MRKIGLITAVLSGAFVMVFTTGAYAQNPFLIEGTVTDTVNSKASGAATKFLDPDGNTKELGPKNGSPQQIGDIHTAAIPMLAETNPNSNNDLNAVWIQSQQAADGHYWLYYGWSRETAGTGVIAIELQKNPSGCNYANLLACNPWGQRSAGDVVFVWDTQGGETTIVKRVFTEENGDVVLPACPQDFPTTQTAECAEVANAVAVFSDSVGDDLRGEAAIDLTAEGILPLNECRTFSNIIPWSGTGNSDSADIKDAVLQQIPPITTCGILKVKKVLLNLTSFTGSFVYQVKRTGDAVLKDPNVTLIQQTLTHNGDEDTIVDLFPGTNYKLDETQLSAPFTKVKIYCVLNSVTYLLFDPADDPMTEPNVVTEFPVAGGATTSCTIENRAVGSPNGATVQAAQVFDQLNLTNVVYHSQLTMTASFSLWTGAGCTGTNLGSVGPVAVTFVVPPGTQAGQTVTGSANTLGTPISVPGSGTFYWKVSWGGDSVNAGNTGFCGETVLISFDGN